MEWEVKNAIEDLAKEKNDNIVALYEQK